ncbi:A/G-specific adenine glycosylase [Allofustis seminis]|uniref:A/G-specific adenine glycosylase n=1 Tax=Allofustis seminis TaxID=166939 RepID=UPI00036F8E4B|nr:A/G-specific adenine glycosylase [Allofustis seminis]
MKIIDIKTLKNEYKIDIWTSTQIRQFQKQLLDWYDEHQRLLPWRENKDPYRIWISEIMLQQTQVDTVIPYFNHFMEKFPSIYKLAEASKEEVLKAWEGLGYYSRAANLHIAAQQVIENYEGKMPNSFDELQTLKGIGPYTAGAIASMAFNQKVPAVDGNVMRVVSRLFEIDLDIKRPKNFKVFFSVVYHLLDEKRPGDCNQALMDLGATIMTPKASRPDLSPVKAFDASYLNESWEHYPVVAKAKAPKLIRKWAIVVKNEDGQYLLEKRPDNGLLANMWTFPLVAENDLQKSKDGKIAKMFNDTLDITDEFEKIKAFMLENYSINIHLENDIVHHVRHIFSHLVWEILMINTTTNATNTPQNCEWTAADKFGQYAFPAVQTKLIQALTEHIQTTLF